MNCMHNPDIRRREKSVFLLKIHLASDDLSEISCLIFRIVNNIGISGLDGLIRFSKKVKKDLPIRPTSVRRPPESTGDHTDFRKADKRRSLGNSDFPVNESLIQDPPDSGLAHAVSH